jgi:hypothetical protein
MAVRRKSNTHYFRINLIPSGDLARVALGTGAAFAKNSGLRYRRQTGPSH